MIVPSNGTCLQIFFNLVLWSWMTYFTYRHRFCSTLPNRGFIWLGMLVFVLFSYWCSDYFHYMNLYYNPGRYDHLEGFYAWLREFTMPSYLIFRFCIWGSALIELYIIIKRIKLPEAYTLFSIFIIFFLWFSYGRVSLAITTSILGLTFVTHPIRPKIISFFLFVAIVSVSIFFHRSALIIVALTLVVRYLPINKYTALFVVLLIPVSIYVLNHYFIYFADRITMTEEDQLLINHYTSGDTNNVDHGVGPRIMWFFQHLSVYSMAIYLIYEQFFKVRKLEEWEYIFFKLAILFLLVTFAFDYSEALSRMTTRIRIMSVFPLSLSFAAHVNRFGENKWTRRVIKIVIMNPIYTLLYMTYCASVS